MHRPTSQKPGVAFEVIQTFDRGGSEQVPTPLHVPVGPHSFPDTGSHESSRGSAPSGIGAHVPCAAPVSSAKQDRQPLVQGESQHTPSVQIPEAQSADDTQPRPLSAALITVNAPTLTAPPSLA